ncbi:MAG: hypothetical protein WCW27_06285 [Patescibacteria group bacterium]|jgi:hypothetical protein
MAIVKPKKTTHLPSTQQHLVIAEIKQDTVVLKDGTLRAVLLVSSINFALKSEDEQQAIIQGYIGFLNSLDFEVQIVMQSRRLVITKYLDQLEDLAKKQTNELLKVQTEEYKQFIGELVTLSDIMEKTFYVVVPYSALSTARKNWFLRAEEVIAPNRVIKLAEQKFIKYRKELDYRINTVVGGLSSIGLQITQLSTEELIKLYYQLYNPTRGSARQLPVLNKLQIDQN